jgi:hypothetical protein
MTINLIDRMLQTGVILPPPRHPGLEPGSRFLSDVAAEAGSRLKAGMTVGARI